MAFLTQPPDPNPHKPKLICPKGSVDSHIHLFGPSDRFQFNPGSKYISNDALPETYMALQDKLGLAYAVVVSGGGYGPDYTHLVDVLQRYPKRFRGVALLPDAVTAEELEKLSAVGVTGCRFISPAHGGSVPPLSERNAAAVAEFGWHVQFYPHGKDLVDFADRLLALPNKRIVIDHFACMPPEAGLDQPAFKCLLKLLDTGRFWVKLSGPMRCTREEPPYPSITPMARALIKHSPDRLVWGSDWPHVNMNDRTMPNDGDLLDQLLEWASDEADRKKLLVTNPYELYGFGADR